MLYDSSNSSMFVHYNVIDMKLLLHRNVKIIELINNELNELMNAYIHLFI